jgi:hypothetical protein
MATPKMASLPLQQFLDKYGTDTTSNFQLLSWSKDLGIPKLYCIMRNELKKLEKLKTKTKPLYIICNYQTSDESGIHWVALYKDKSKDLSYYFDSYGIQPFKEAIDFLDTKDRYYSSFQIQKLGTKICGSLCLYVLYKLSQDEDFFDIVLKLNDELF